MPGGICCAGGESGGGQRVPENPALAEVSWELEATPRTSPGGQSRFEWLSSAPPNPRLAAPLPAGSRAVASVKSTWSCCVGC